MKQNIVADIIPDICARLFLKQSMLIANGMTEHPNRYASFMIQTPRFQFRKLVLWFGIAPILSQAAMSTAWSHAALIFRETVHMPRLLAGCLKPSKNR
jgi:hypothetical protein